LRVQAVTPSTQPPPLVVQDARSPATDPNVLMTQAVTDQPAFQADATQEDAPAAPALVATDAMATDGDAQQHDEGRAEDDLAGLDQAPPAATQQPTVAINSPVFLDTVDELVRRTGLQCR
jgi:hypothetical protein